MEDKKNKLDKSFGLTSFALKNGTTVLFLTFLIVIMGVTTYMALPRENFPEINIPKIYIGVSHPGNSPSDIENLITRTIEKEINTISEIDNITSTSIQDYSTIIAEFTADTEVEDALNKVKDAVDKDWSHSHEMFITSVPTFLINEQRLVGAQPYEALKQLMANNHVNEKPVLT